MAKKFDELQEMLDEKVTCVADDHPVAVAVGGGILGLALALPLCWLGYRFAGKTAGKAAAKELAKAGVWLGYTHD